MGSLLAALKAIPQILKAIEAIANGIHNFQDTVDERRTDKFKARLDEIEAQMKRKIDQGIFNEQDAMDMARTINDARGEL